MTTYANHFIWFEGFVFWLVLTAPCLQDSKWIRCRKRFIHKNCKCILKHEKLKYRESFTNLLYVYSYCANVYSNHHTGSSGVTHSQRYWLIRSTYIELIHAYTIYPDIVLCTIVEQEHCRCDRDHSWSPESDNTRVLSCTIHIQWI